MKNMQAAKTNRWIAGLLALLFAAGFLLILPGCQGPVGSHPDPAGTLSLTIDRPAARTIMPGSDWSDYLDEFSLLLTPRGAGGAITRDWDGEGSLTIDLAAGTWDVVISAYREGEDEPRAMWTSGEAGIVISAGEISPVKATLGPIAEGQGAFHWDISFPGIVAGVTILITEFGASGGGETLTFTPEDFEDGVGGTLTLTGYKELDAGQYLVVFSLFSGDVELGHVVFSEILHVWHDLESRFEGDRATFAIGDFPLPGEQPELGGYVTIGGILNVRRALTAIISELTGTLGGETFAWYRAPAADGAFEPITGATAITYVLTTDDEDKFIRVRVRRLGWDGYVLSGPSGPIAAEPVSVAEQLADLLEMPQPPATFTILTGMPEEPLAPQVLYFDGEEITITLTGTAGDALYLYNGPGAMFTVGEGVTLVLEDVELRGMDGNNRAVVWVDDGGTFTMNAGTRITGNNNTHNVFMHIGGGVTNMGVFNMHGGTIDDNTALLGGGVNNLGDFNLYGGTITNNIGSNSGGGVASLFGGLFVMRNGASITDNVSARGGGVLTSLGGQFHMHGGEISSNEATGEAGGGGVLVIAATGGLPGSTSLFRMYGGEIFENTAELGGGVAAGAQGVFHMHDGEIFENTAELGGGVFNTGAGWFTMRGGEIYGNTATQGGGVNNNLGGFFFMSDGLIQGVNAPVGIGNTATELGSALLSMPDANTGFGTLTYDGDILNWSGFFMPTTNLTVDVVNGEAARISITNIPTRYSGHAGRLWVYFDDDWHNIGGTWLVPGTLTASFSFSTTPGNWAFELEFFEVEGGYIITPPVGIHTVSTDIARELNTIPFANFTPMPVPAFGNMGRSGMAAPQRLAPTGESLTIPEGLAHTERLMNQPNDTRLPSVRRASEHQRLQQMPREQLQQLR